MMLKTHSFGLYLRNTVITLFFVLEIFSDGTRYPKICYTNIIPVRRIFSIESLLFGSTVNYACKYGVNGTTL